MSAASSRAAVVVSGHEVHEMQDWCTRFVVLNRGRVVAMYRASDYSRSQLAKLLETQMTSGFDGGVGP